MPYWGKHKISFLWRRAILYGGIAFLFFISEGVDKNSVWARIIITVREYSSVRAVHFADVGVQPLFFLFRRVLRIPPLTLFPFRLKLQLFE